MIWKISDAGHGKCPVSCATKGRSMILQTSGQKWWIDGILVREDNTHCRIRLLTNRRNGRAMKMGYAIQVLLASAFSAVNNASRVLVVVFCASSTTQGAETQATPAPANLVSNWPAGAPPSHVVPAVALPTQEPVIEPPSSAPTNGPSLTDFGVGASGPVRQEIRLLDDGAVGDYGLQKVF